MFEGCCLTAIGLVIITFGVLVVCKVFLWLLADAFTPRR